MAGNNLLVLAVQLLNFLINTLDTLLDLLIATELSIDVLLDPLP
jgi:hypothetical protein